MNRLTKSFAVLALLGMLAAPMQSSAQTLMTPGTWYDVVFTSDGAGGSTTSDSFLLPGSGWFDISYRDCCVAGDVYQVFADGSLIGTSDAAPDVVTTFTSAAQGGQVLTLAMPVFGGGLDAGSSIMATASVPEPGTMLLVATGLLGLCVPRRRREDEEELSI